MNQNSQIHIPSRLQKAVRLGVAFYEIVTGAFALIVVPLNVVVEVRWLWLLIAIVMIGIWVGAHWLLEKEARMWRKIERYTPALGFVLWILIGVADSVSEAIRSGAALGILLLAVFWYTQSKKSNTA